MFAFLCFSLIYITFDDLIIFVDVALSFDYWLKVERIA